MSDSRSAPQTSRLLAEGRGWQAREVVCTAGPRDPAFEERHDSFSVAAVIGGTFTYRSTHGAEFLAPGSLLLGNAGACFECGHDHGTGDSCIAFHYAPDFFEDIAANIPAVTSLDFPVHRIPPATAPLLERARRAASDKDAAALEEIALTIGAEAIAASRGLTPPARANPKAAEVRRVTDAVRFIESNYADDISLADLSARQGLGRYHFLRLFRQIAGITPYQFLLRVRLSAAAQTLREGQGNVLATALACGFGDLSEFTRRFRRVFGITPATYSQR